VAGARGAWFVGRIEGADGAVLRDAADAVRGALGSGAAVFAAENEGKVSWIVIVTADLVQAKIVAAGDVLKAAEIKGGGKPDLAQGGGQDPAAVPGQLRKMADFLASKLESAAAETWTA
jgi:alanyl-tRNA synthetase